jgi:hypothetical protein
MSSIFNFHDFSFSLKELMLLTRMTTSLMSSTSCTFYFLDFFSFFSERVDVVNNDLVDVVNVMHFLLA